jgi:FixJ family two-component response regulator
MQMHHLSNRPESPVQRLDSKAKRYVVAIVDDDAATREALARLLRIHRIESRTYASARAFLEAISSGVPNCLIVDVNMPDMTGLELQRELLNAGTRIPTIVVTANDDARVAVSAASLGAAAFFQKPVASEELIAAVTSALEGNGPH